LIARIVPKWPTNLELQKPRLLDATTRPLSTVILCHLRHGPIDRYLRFSGVKSRFWIRINGKFTNTPSQDLFFHYWYQIKAHACRNRRHWSSGLPRLGRRQTNTVPGGKSIPLSCFPSSNYCIQIVPISFAECTRLMWLISPALRFAYQSSTFPLFIQPVVADSLDSPAK